MYEISMFIFSANNNVTEVYSHQTKINMAQFNIKSNVELYFIIIINN